MFTGLIQDIGIINSIEKNGDWKILIETNLMNLNSVEIGASIACDGVCLTAVEKGPSWFVVDVSHESLDKTKIQYWETGARVNLERSLRLGDELGGHIVSGHVDCLAEVIGLEEDHDSWRFKVKVPQSFSKFIASKGSVALDGISLTVNEVEDDVFGVNIIPHTWEYTTLSNRKVGDKLNLEIDMLARYVARQLEFKGDDNVS
ncbi:MAG: riboflavin synthase [Bdellovibrionales bacterium]